MSERHVSTGASAADDTELSFDAFDERNDPRPEETGFDRVVEEAVSRRGFLGGAVAVGTGAFLTGTAALTAGDSPPPPAAGWRSRRSPPAPRTR